MAIESKTTPVAWSIGKLQAAWGEAKGDTQKLDLPRFQRAPVWSDDQRQKLVHSLKAGYPVGSLLFYERATSKGKSFLLVDGLQGTLAIRAYVESPLSLVEPEELVSPSFGRVQKEVERLAEVNQDDATALRGLTDWLRATRTLNAGDGFDAANLIVALSAAHSIDPPGPAETRLYKNASDFQDEIRKKVDISAIELPVIIFEGDESHLPEIFERINRQGTILSRFDVFAASWVNQATSISNQKIVDYIDAKYQSMVDLGFSYDGLAEESTEFSLYEYLFGLGKFLTEEHPLLFGKGRDAARPESIGFTLATIMHGHRLSEMKNLPTFFLRDDDDVIDPSLFESAVREACAAAESILKPYIGITLNRQGSTIKPEHTEYQIASIICRLAISRFSMSGSEELPNWKSDWKTLRARIPQHYLFDALRLTWRGSGDTRLFERTWDSADEGEPSAHYLQRITKKEWDDQLDLWFDEQMRRNQRRRSAVRSLDKLFLKFVYSDKVTVFDDYGTKFDLEHLYPVARLSNLVKDDERGWPISCIANLALLPADINRKKRDETVSQYLAKLTGPKRTRAQNLMRRYLLCRVPDVAIAKNSKGRDLLTREEYEAFLEKRYEAMREQVLKSLRVIPK